VTEQVTARPLPEIPINWGAVAGLLAAGAVLLLPEQAGLPIAGQRMLAVLAFAVVVWLTEALDYAVSSVVIVALMALLLGTAPSLANPQTDFGTARALGIALGGFANTALALVGAALFLAAAMTLSGLDRRLALFTLAQVGTSTRRVLLGAIGVTIVLSFLIPSATARTACVVPIMMGVIAAFGVDKHSRFAAAILITIAQATSVWNIGVQTAAAQNILGLGFMQKALGTSVSWSDWLIAGAPWALAMSAVLYFTVVKLLPPETDRIEGGKDSVKKALADLGPMSGPEKRILAISAALLGFWVSEGKLHSFDTSTTTIVGLALMFWPRMRIMTWAQAQKNIPWSTLIVFGVGISLGTALLDTKAASWLADIVVRVLHLESLSPFWIFAALSAFLIAIHLGFASATALTSAMLPIMIAVLTKIPGEINVPGMTMLLLFTVSFGFILPVNAPQNMVCMATETFSARQFTKVGLVITLAGYAMLLLFAATWWRFLGYI
jgi:sodium-dependent dicarboxylate transporter 2/3/5